MDSPATEPGVLLNGFNAFRNDPSTKLSHHGHDTIDNRLLVWLPVDIADQAHIQLEEVGRARCQQVVAGKTRTKIVDRGAESHTLVCLDDGHQVVYR